MGLVFHGGPILKSRGDLGNVFFRRVAGGVLLSLGMIRRLLLTLLPATLLLILASPYFFYRDADASCSLVIWPGTEFSNGVIKEALGVLRIEAPEDYRELCEHVDEIG